MKEAYNIYINSKLKEIAKNKGGYKYIESLIQKDIGVTQEEIPKQEVHTGKIIQNYYILDKSTLAQTTLKPNNTKNEGKKTIDLESEN